MFFEISIYRHKMSKEEKFSTQFTFRVNSSPAKCKVRKRKMSTPGTKVSPKMLRSRQPKSSRATATKKEISYGRANLGGATRKGSRSYTKVLELLSRYNNAKEQQGTLNTQTEKTSQSKKEKTSLSKKVLKKQVLYELSDDEDCALDTEWKIFGNSTFCDQPSTEMNVSTTIDLDEDATEVLSLQKFDRENNLMQLCDITSLESVPSLKPVPSPESAPSQKSVPLLKANAAMNSTTSTQSNEIFNTITQNMLASDDAVGFHVDDNKSNKEFLADIDKLLFDNLNVLHSTRSARTASEIPSTSNTLPRTGAVRKCNPKLDASVIEVIDLSSEYSPPGKGISKYCLKTTHEKSTNSEQSDTALKRNLGDCPICLEPIGNQTVASTICGHIFCDSCIRSCIKNTKKCPNCRKTLNQKQIHPLFI